MLGWVSGDSDSKVSWKTWLCNYQLQHLTFVIQFILFSLYWPIRTCHVRKKPNFVHNEISLVVICAEKYPVGSIILFSENSIARTSFGNTVFLLVISKNFKAHKPFKTKKLTRSISVVKTFAGILKMKSNFTVFYS